MGAADSKLAFKKGVFRLFEERNIPSSANDYWEQILDHLFRLCESPRFLTPHAPAIHVLNCVRVLTRIFPFVFESEDLMDWEERYFWSPRSAVALNSQPDHTLTGTSTRPVLAETLSEPDLGQPSGESSGSNRAKQQRLMKTLLDLLFTSGFTLPTALDTQARVSHVIWETGVGSSKPIGTSKELDDNRTEILRLILVLFSRSMYIPPTAIIATENRWIDAVVTGSDRQVTLAILCSLINSALKYNPSGWGLPYNHVMFSDQRELLVILSLQTIVVLLDYHVIDRPQAGLRHDAMAGVRIGKQARPEAHLGSTTLTSSSASSPQGATASTQTGDTGVKNQFRYYLSRLHRDQDFIFLTDGMYRILSNPMARFRTYLLETNRVLDIVVILLYFSLEHKQDACK
ncbi:hypothetical protein BGX28_003278 [Mortierella sp. GBA30]|nr:hypothetical protein BGX28_003278 [Mortierella sp. GBA30]